MDAPEFTLQAMLHGTPLVVIAAGLQDPGNLGTLGALGGSLRRHRHDPASRHREPMEREDLARLFGIRLPPARGDYDR